MRRLLNYFLLLPLYPLLPLQADYDEAKLHALYLMQQNQVEEALERYREFSQVTGKQDFELLQQMGQLFLQKGAMSPDPQTFLMTLFGAGLSGSVHSLDILEKGLFHPEPQVQLLALHFLTRMEDDRIHELLNRAMSSEFLSTRMEAAYGMATRKHPNAVGQIEGLMVRLPPAFKPYFPSLFALLGTPEATQALRRLIEDPDPQVRVESILNVARLGRDDFLPLLRKRLSNHHLAELEAVCYAMGLLKDSSSLPKLKKLASSSLDSVRLAALFALFQLGDRTLLPQVEEMAKGHNLFAITLLGSLPGTEELLAKLASSDDLQVRMNAASALLQKRDPRCLSPLLEMLILDQRDLAFHPFASVGRTLTAWKAVPSAQLRADDPTLDLSLSLSIREHLLRESIHLPEATFLAIGKEIFAHQQNDLVPTLISLLENLQTAGAIALLKEGSLKKTSPLIRDYCHLALYRLKEEDEEYVHRWVMRQKEAELIRLRPLLPWKYRTYSAELTLTPEETSRLLIETFLSMAQRREEKSIAFLLEAIQKGNPDNRYALMGLLMQATE